MKTVDVSLKELLVYLLRKWRVIFAFALVFAIIFGAYSYVAPKLSKTSRAITSVGDQSTYTLSVSINLTDFHGTSPDSYHITLATNDLLAKIQSRYLKVAQGAPLTKLLENFVPKGLTEEELHQLVSVTVPLVGMIDITIPNREGIDKDKSIDAVYQYLKEHEAAISTSVANHTLTKLTIATLTGDVSEQSTTAQGNSKHLRSALIGFLLGFVIGVIAMCVVYLIRLPVQTAEYLQQQTGMWLLGGVSNKRKNGLLDKISGSQRISSEDEALPLIAANIRELAGDNKKILFIGSIPEVFIREFSEKIAPALETYGLTQQSGGNVNQSLETIKRMNESDAIVLVERVNVSRLKDVYDESTRINKSNKQILGYVLY